MINKTKQYVKNEQQSHDIIIEARKGMSRKEYQQLSNKQYARYKSERIREKLSNRNNIGVTQHSTQEKFKLNINELNNEVEQAYSKWKTNKSLNSVYFKQRKSHDLSIIFRSSSRKTTRDYPAMHISHKSVNSSKNKVIHNRNDSISILNEKSFAKEIPNLVTEETELTHKKAFNLILPDFNHHVKERIWWNPIQSLKASSSSK